MIDWIQNKHFVWKNIFTTGWFPSVHSAMTSSLVTLVYLDQGISSVLFTVAFVFMFLISYDAMNLRFEAGKHAHYINTLKHDVESVLQRKESEILLKERMWHTPFEVIWGIILWCLLTFLLYKYVYIG